LPAFLIQREIARTDRSDQLEAGQAEAVAFHKGFEQHALHFGVEGFGLGVGRVVKRTSNSPHDEGRS